MYKSSFHLQGWETEEVAAPLSHRLQLQPLQEIITKAKDTSPKITKTKLPTFSSTKYSNRETEPFRSANVIRKKIKTQPQGKQLKTLSQPVKEIIEQKIEQAYSREQYFRKNDANASFFKSIITFIQKQPTALKKSPRFILEHNKKQEEALFAKNKRHSKSMNILPKKQQLKVKEKFETISKFKISFKNEGLNGRILPITRQQSITKLKRFFLQTIQGIQNKNKEKIQKIHETKLKNMLQKSNRKKKQIQELFKTRVIVGTNLKQRKAKLTLQKLLIEPQQRIKNRSKRRMFSNNEFDDQGLFCPWTYKDQKIINYMKSKHIQ